MNYNEFVYTYSAKEQEKIRSKYVDKEENKIEKLHRLGKVLRI